MTWRVVHRWLGLIAGAVAVLLGVTGVILATNPLQDAWRSTTATANVPVAALVRQVSATIPGVEEIRRLTSGELVVHSFDNDVPRAQVIDPANGRVLGDYQPSALSRWVKNLHRSFLLGDTGRVLAAAMALVMLLLSLSGLVLLVRRLGGWRRLGGRVRGSLVQRIHVTTGRVMVAALLLSATSALYMSAATFGLVTTDADLDPDVASVTSTAPSLPGDQIPLLQSLTVAQLRKLGFPNAADPADTWKVVTDDGRGWIDRNSGKTLVWQTPSTAQRLQDWVTVLHTGQGAWAWAVVLAFMGGSIPLFFGSGLILWWQAYRERPRIANNAALPSADVLIFVGSENGSTWRFAQALHEAFVRSGRKVHTSGLEHFRAGAAARQIFVLAATYGDGQAPAHAARALERIAHQPVSAVPVTVLGFGDRQFTAFCAFAEAVDRALRARGWAQLLPLERIHQQSAQEFVRWGEALAEALGEPLPLDYTPRVPPSFPLELVSRRHYAGGSAEPVVILRFAWPASRWTDRLRGRALPRFVAGDLVAIMPPASPVPRYYSLASGYRDGFVEICVRRVPDGLCAGYLHGLVPGDRIAAFIQPNPGFALQGSRRPVVLIGAGTGVAPLVGFIRGNTRHAPMHLYYGARDPAHDFYFDREIQHWLDEQRLASLRTAFSRTPNGGGYVQDALRGDTARLRELVVQGAEVRVCGNRSMAQAVAQVLDGILGTVNLSVPKLKAAGRYAEDVF